MIEEIKGLLTILQDVPGAVTNVILGFGIYKLIIYLSTSAGIYGIARLLINKVYDYNMNELNQRREEFKQRQIEWELRNSGSSLPTGKRAV